MTRYTLPLLAAGLLLALNAPSYAQTANAGAGALAGANAQSGAAAGAQAVGGGNAGINQTFEGSNRRQVQGDNTKATIENVPDIIPPNITHTNPCIISYSAGAGVVGVGAAIGFGIKDENCQTINMGVYLAQVEAGNESLKGMNLSLHYVCSQNEEVQQLAMLRGISDCGKAKQVAEVQPAAFVAPPPAPPIPPGNAKRNNGTLGCAFGFDRVTGQCAKKTAFVDHLRADG